MRFKRSPRTEPKHGDQRTRTRFAWLPVRIGDAAYLWCQYDEMQVYQKPVVKIELQTFTGMGGKWVTVAKKPVKWILAS